MNDELVVKGMVSGYRSMVDGGGRVTIDFSEVEWKRVKLLDYGQEVAVAALNGKALDTPPPPPEGSVEHYGSYAKQLWMSVFMGTKEVWQAVGTDDEFLSFVRTQKCCARSGSPCEGPIQAAHVWRLRDGFGKGVKGPYAAVALCAKHHRLQHQNGEDAVGGRAYLESQRERTVKEWVWINIKDAVGVASMREADPKLVIEWANANGIAKYLPADYLEAS